MRIANVGVNKIYGLKRLINILNLLVTATIRITDRYFPL